MRKYVPNSATIGGEFRKLVPVAVEDDVVVPVPIGTPLNKITGGAGTGAGTNNSGLISTTDENLVVVFAGCEFPTAVPNAPTISDTAGWTWTLQDDQSYDTAANPRLRCRVWTAISDGQDNTITVLHGNGLGAGMPIGLSVIEVPGGALTLLNKSVDTDAAGDPSMTFGSAFEDGSAALVFILAGANAVFGAITGYTQLAQAGYASNAGRIGAFYDLTSPGAAASLSTNTFIIMVGYEVEQAVK